MTDDVIRQRVEEARAEVERALSEIEGLAARLDGGSFDEPRHTAAKARLRAALAHLESLRPAHHAPPPGGV